MPLLLQASSSSAPRSTSAPSCYSTSLLVSRATTTQQPATRSCGSVSVQPPPRTPPLPHGRVEVTSASNGVATASGVREQGTSTSSMASWRGSGSSTGSSKMHGSSTSNGKITNRRPRVPGRFVVTDLPPEEDEFLPSQELAAQSTSGTQDDDRTWSLENELGDSQGPSLGMSHSQTQLQGRSQGAGLGGPAPLPASSSSSASARLPRPGKTEIRGRFTITDLSPDSDSSPITHVASAPVLSDTLAGTVSGPITIYPTENRRRALPRRFSNSSAHAMAAAAAAALHDAQMETQSVSSVASSVESARRIPTCSRYAPPLRVSQGPVRSDLNGFDRHLELMQQESIDMKATLESMIATNARWIDALAAAGVGKAPGESLSLSRVSSQPIEPIEDRYERVQFAYIDLERKFDTLKREKALLEHQNAILESRLQQQAKLSQNHIDQLTRYVDSLLAEKYSDSQSSTAQTVAGQDSSTETTVECVDAAVQVDEKMVVTTRDSDASAHQGSERLRDRSSSTSSTGSMWDVARRFASSLQVYSNYTPASDLFLGMGTHNVLTELQRAASTSSLTSFDSRPSDPLGTAQTAQACSEDWSNLASASESALSVRETQRVQSSFDRRGSVSSTQSNHSTYSNQDMERRALQESFKHTTMDSQLSSPATSERSSLEGPVVVLHHRRPRSRASSRHSSEPSPTHHLPRTMFDRLQHVQ